MMKKTGDQLAAQLKVHLLYMGRRSNAAIVFYTGTNNVPCPIGVFEFWDEQNGVSEEEQRVDVYFASDQYIQEPKQFPATPEGMLEAMFWIQNEFETGAEDRQQEMLDLALGNHNKGSATRSILEMFLGVAEGQVPGITQRMAETKRQKKIEQELAENPEYVRIENTPRVVDQNPLLRIINRHPEGRTDIPTNAQQDAAQVFGHYRVFNAGDEGLDPTNTHALQELDDRCLAGWEVVDRLALIKAPHADALLIGELKDGVGICYRYWAVPVEVLSSLSDGFVIIKNVEKGNLVLEGPEPDQDQVIAATAIGHFDTEFVGSEDPDKDLIRLTVELVQRYRSLVPAGWEYLSTECGGGRLIPARSIQIGEIRCEDGQLRRQLWIIPETKADEEGT